jgi:aminoglycoside phosphotransferase (APT) family kinase protein
VTIAAAADPDTIARRAEAALRQSWTGAEVSMVAPLPGGASSLTYVAELTEGTAPADRVVVKMAPPGLEPVRNRDVLRQARVLDLLSAAPDVAVPAVLGTDGGEPPDVPPLFVMTMVEGESFEPTNGPGDPPPFDIVEARALSAARMLARLHAVDPLAPALDGERTYQLSDEVNRWSKAFATVEGDLRPDTVDRCRDDLLGTAPEALPAAVLHGDWRLGNMLCQGPAINAVIDWEIWSLADPRIDLAWFLLMADTSRSPGLRSGTGLPDPERLAAVYEQERGVPLEAIDWFLALVRYKQAAASALIVKNNRKSSDPDPRALSFAGIIAPLLDGALGYLRRAEGQVP